MQSANSIDLSISDNTLSDLPPENWSKYHIRIREMDLLKEGGQRRLIGRAASDSTLLFAIHLQLPGLGLVVQEGKGWRWEPIDTKI